MLHVHLAEAHVQHVMPKTVIVQNVTPVNMCWTVIVLIALQDIHATEPQLKLNAAQVRMHQKEVPLVLLVYQTHLQQELQNVIVYQIVKHAVMMEPVQCVNQDIIFPVANVIHVLQDILVTAQQMNLNALQVHMQQQEQVHVQDVQVIPGHPQELNHVRHVMLHVQHVVIHQVPVQVVLRVTIQKTEVALHVLQDILVTVQSKLNVPQVNILQQEQVHVQIA